MPTGGKIPFKVKGMPKGYSKLGKPASATRPEFDTTQVVPPAAIAQGEHNAMGHKAFQRVPSLPPPVPSRTAGESPPLSEVSSSNAETPKSTQRTVYPDSDPPPPEVPDAEAAAPSRADEVPIVDKRAASVSQSHNDGTAESPITQEIQVDEVRRGDDDKSDHQEAKSDGAVRNEAAEILENRETSRSPNEGSDENKDPSSLTRKTSEADDADTELKVSPSSSATDRSDKAPSSEHLSSTPDLKNRDEPEGHAGHTPTESRSDSGAEDRSQQDVDAKAELPNEQSGAFSLRTSQVTARDKESDTSDDEIHEENVKPNRVDEPASDLDDEVAELDVKDVNEQLTREETLRRRSSSSQESLENAKFPSANLIVVTETVQLLHESQGDTSAMPAEEDSRFKEIVVEEIPSGTTKVGNGVLEMDSIASAAKFETSAVEEVKTEVVRIMSTQSGRTFHHFHHESVEAIAGDPLRDVAYERDIVNIIRADGEGREGGARWGESIAKDDDNRGGDVQHVIVQEAEIEPEGTMSDSSSTSIRTLNQVDSNAVATESVNVNEVHHVIKKRSTSNERSSSSLERPAIGSSREESYQSLKKMSNERLLDTQGIDDVSEIPSYQFLQQKIAGDIPSSNKFSSKEIDVAIRSVYEPSPHVSLDTAMHDFLRPSGIESIDVDPYHYALHQFGVIEVKPQRDIDMQTERRIEEVPSSYSDSDEEEVENQWKRESHQRSSHHEMVHSGSLRGDQPQMKLRQSDNYTVPYKRPNHEEVLAVAVAEADHIASRPYQIVTHTTQVTDHIWRSTTRELDKDEVTLSKANVTGGVFSGYTDGPSPSIKVESVDVEGDEEKKQSQPVTIANESYSTVKGREERFPHSHETAPPGSNLQLGVAVQPCTDDSQRTSDVTKSTSTETEGETVALVKEQRLPTHMRSSAESSLHKVEGSAVSLESKSVEKATGDRVDVTASTSMKQKVTVQTFDLSSMGAEDFSPNLPAPSMTRSRLISSKGPPQVAVVQGFLSDDITESASEVHSMLTTTPDFDSSYRSAMSPNLSPPEEGKRDYVTEEDSEEEGSYNDDEDETLVTETESEVAGPRETETIVPIISDQAYPMRDHVDSEDIQNVQETSPESEEDETGSTSSQEEADEESERERERLDLMAARHSTENQTSEGYGEESTGSHQTLDVTERLRQLVHDTQAMMADTEPREGLSGVQILDAIQQGGPPVSSPRVEVNQAVDQVGDDSSQAHDSSNDEEDSSEEDEDTHPEGSTVSEADNNIAVVVGLTDSLANMIMSVPQPVGVATYIGAIPEQGDTEQVTDHIAEQTSQDVASIRRLQEGPGVSHPKASQITSGDVASPPAEEGSEASDARSTSYEIAQVERVLPPSAQSTPVLGYTSVPMSFTQHVRTTPETIQEQAQRLVAPHTEPIHRYVHTEGVHGHHDHSEGGTVAQVERILPTQLPTLGASEKEKKMRIYQSTTPSYQSTVVTPSHQSYETVTTTRTNHVREVPQYQGGDEMIAMPYRSNAVADSTQHMRLQEATSFVDQRFAKETASRDGVMLHHEKAYQSRETAVEYNEKIAQTQSRQSPLIASSHLPTIPIKSVNEESYYHSAIPQTTQNVYASRATHTQVTRHEPHDKTYDEREVKTSRASSMAAYHHAQALPAEGNIFVYNPEYRSPPGSRPVTPRSDNTKQTRYTETSVAAFQTPHKSSVLADNASSWETYFQSQSRHPIPYRTPTTGAAGGRIPTSQSMTPRLPYSPARPQTPNLASSVSPASPPPMNPVRSLRQDTFFDYQPAFRPASKSVSPLQRPSVPDRPSTRLMQPLTPPEVTSSHTTYKPMEPSPDPAGPSYMFGSKGFSPVAAPIYTSGAKGSASGVAASSYTLGSGVATSSYAFGAKESSSGLAGSSITVQPRVSSTVPQAPSYRVETIGTQERASDISQYPTPRQTESITKIASGQSTVRQMEAISGAPRHSIVWSSSPSAGPVNRDSEHKSFFGRPSHFANPMDQPMSARLGVHTTTKIEEDVRREGARHEELRPLRNPSRSLSTIWRPQSVNHTASDIRNWPITTSPDRITQSRSPTPPLVPSQVESSLGWGAKDSLRRDGVMRHSTSIPEPSRAAVSTTTVTSKGTMVWPPLIPPAERETQSRYNTLPTPIKADYSTSRVPAEARMDELPRHSTVTSRSYSSIWRPPSRLPSTESIAWHKPFTTMAQYPQRRSQGMVALAERPNTARALGGPAKSDLLSHREGVYRHRTANLESTAAARRRAESVIRHATSNSSAPRQASTNRASAAAVQWSPAPMDWPATAISPSSKRRSRSLKKGASVQRKKEGGLCQCRC